MLDMSTDKTCVINSTSSEATEQLAEQLGSKLRGGEVIELVSDLGGGKTTFTRGIAKGAGSTDKVASPTFTISKVYKTEKLEIHHFDFYRLVEGGMAAHELHDLVGDPQTVIVVEWGGVVEDVLPKEKLTVDIKRTGEESRQLTFTCPDSLQYLTEKIC